MTLPLPYSLGDDDDPIQGNFDELKKQFPLTRRHMSIESAHVVGAAGEPVFQNSWVNFGAPHQSARFWKDPMGVVHIEGLVKSGTVGAAGVIFTLPAGYRPGGQLLWGVISGLNTLGRIDVETDGDVIATAGNNAFFPVNVQFKQEQ